MPSEMSKNEYIEALESNLQDVKTLQAEFKKDLLKLHDFLKDALDSDSRDPDFYRSKLNELFYAINECIPNT